jgi:hypothetical protein
MSRGLGPTQLAALALLADRRRGLLTSDLATLLDVGERQARTVVASLVDRGEVEVHRDPGEAQKVWLPQHRREKEWVAVLLDRYSTREVSCPTCKTKVNRTASGRYFPLRAIEPEWIIGKGWS